MNAKIFSATIFSRLSGKSFLSILSNLKRFCLLFKRDKFFVLRVHYFLRKSKPRPLFGIFPSEVWQRRRFQTLNWKQDLFPIFMKFWESFHFTFRFIFRPEPESCRINPKSAAVLYLSEILGAQILTPRGEQKKIFCHFPKSSAGVCVFTQASFFPSQHPRFVICVKNLFPVFLTVTHLVYTFP